MGWAAARCRYVAGQQVRGSVQREFTRGRSACCQCVAASTLNASVVAKIDNPSGAGWLNPAGDYTERRKVCISFRRSICAASEVGIKSQAPLISELTAQSIWQGYDDGCGGPGAMAGVLPSWVNRNLTAH